MIVRDLLLYFLYANWILGAIMIVFNLNAMREDFKLLFLTFIFGLYGYINYVYD